MAAHVFSDAAWEQYKADRKQLHGGKRQIHLRKNFTRKGRASAGGGGALGIFAWVNVLEAGASPGDPFYVANPWEYFPSGEEDPENEGEWLPGTWGADPSWDLVQGSVEHLKRLEEPAVEGDEPTTPEKILVYDPFMDSPIEGNLARIEGAAGALEFKSLRAECV